MSVCLPVIMMTLMPACRHIRTAPSTSFLGGSNMPTQPTKVRSDWEEGRDGGKTFSTSSASPLSSTGITNGLFVNTHHHLIVSEGSQVLKVEAVNVRGRVSGCHGEATQRVSARSPFPHCGQELLSNRRAQRHAGRTADPDIIAALQHTLWSSLTRDEEEDMTCLFIATG